MTKKQKKEIKIILKAVKELKWEIAISNKNKKVKGMIIGTDKYINKLLDKN